MDLFEFVKINTLSFDESHDYNHALQVYRNALKISQDYPNIDLEIIKYAAMLHDVCDHKYPNSIPKAELENYIRNSLRPEKAQIVIDVINNISYSQQVNGKRKVLLLPLRLYQDIISDADKLEALGQTGLLRCVQFTKARGGKVPEDVVRHCHDKLLKLKDNFIATNTGKKMAEPLHAVIEEFARNSIVG